MLRTDGTRGRSERRGSAGDAGADKSLALPETEAGFQQAVVHLAQACGWKLYHTRFSFLSNKGFPDLVLVRPPYVIMAEIKTEKGKQTKEQREWAELLMRCPGVETYLWRPSDWQTIMERLTRRNGC